MGYGYICMEELKAADRREWVPLGEVRTTMKILKETREVLEKAEKSAKKRRLHEAVHTHKQQAEEMLETARDLLKRSLNLEEKAALLQPIEKEEEEMPADAAEDGQKTLKRKAEESAISATKEGRELAEAAQGTKEGSEALQKALDKEDLEKEQEMIDQNEQKDTLEKQMIPTLQMPPPMLPQKKKTLRGHVERRTEEIEKQKEEIEKRKVEAEINMLQVKMDKLKMEMTGTGTVIGENMAQTNEEKAHKVRQGELAMKINANPFAKVPSGGWKASAPPPVRSAGGGEQMAASSGDPRPGVTGLGFLREQMAGKMEERLPPQLPPLMAGKMEEKLPPLMETKAYMEEVD
jgi:hypothetical protein